jgi:hypothetical protein
MFSDLVAGHAIYLPFIFPWFQLLLNGLCPNNYTHIFYQKHPAIYVTDSMVLPALGDAQLNNAARKRNEKRKMTRMRKGQNNEKKRW